MNEPGMELATSSKDFSAGADIIIFFERVVLEKMFVFLLPFGADGCLGGGRFKTLSCVGRRRPRVIGK